MQKRFEKVIFTIYLLGFIVLALTLVLFQPMGNTFPLLANPPDEHARYLIPKYICEHGVIPTGLEEEVRIPGYGFSYGLYNVFPYIVQGYVMRFVSLFTESELVLLYSARLVNVVFGVAMAVVVYFLGKRIFRDARLRWLFCFGVMYLPQNLFLHTYVNTDSCCMLSTAMMVYALVKCYQDGINRNNSLWMSGGIILCALSYYNAYGYILACIFLFLAYFFQKENGKVSYAWKEMLKWGIFISAIVLAGISWWFIRSYIVLDGDILGLETRKELASMYAIDIVNPSTSPTYQDRGYSVWEMLREENTFECAFITFVASYGSLAIQGNIWLYRLYKLLFGAGAVGVVWHFLAKRKQNRVSGKKLFFHLNMLFCMLLPMALMIYYSYTMDYQDQGRYLLPALVPLMYYVVRGIEELIGFKWKQFAVPERVANVVLVFGILAIIVGTVHMVYFCAMPMYLETGMVL